MAIQSRNNFFGAEAPQAYSRISSILIEGDRVQIQVQTWFNAQAAAQSKDESGRLQTAQPPIGGMTLEVTGEEFNALAKSKPEAGSLSDAIRGQAYQLLMKSSRFSQPVAV